MPSRIKALSEKWRSDIGDYVIGLAWSPDGGLLAAASIGGKIAVLGRGTGYTLHNLGGHEMGVCSVSWSPDGLTLASGGQDGRVRLWDMESGAQRLSVEAGAYWVEAVSWSPKGGILASAAGRELRLWDMGGALLESHNCHDATITDIAWKPGGDDAIAVSAYGGITVHYPGNPSRRRHLKWKGSALALAWSPDAKFIAAGDQDSTAHLWFERDGNHLQMSGYPTKVRELSWSASSRYLATGGGSEPLIWDCSGRGPQGTKPLALNGHGELITALAFQNRGAALASACQGAIVLLWLPGKTTHPTVASRLDLPASQLAWSPDDKYLAVGTEGGAVALLTV
ncbi:MAG: WD40 repeat domain-containing protein [Deltaproteobacteria bacterium]